jgi:hypothetical protein
MQRRNSSVVQSFIRKVGSLSQPCLEELPSFFSFKWPPHVEIYATFKLGRFLVQICGAPSCALFIKSTYILWILISLGVL